MRSARLVALATTVSLTLPGCMMMDHGGMDDVAVPALIDIGRSSADFAAALAENGSSRRGEVSFELEAREANVELADGRSARLWTYNGSMPGPTLEAHVGDLIRVHLINSLPVETTIHWHGVRVPAEMDGVAATIAPGADFTYEFTALDAGTFWYHPHVASNEQVERGLYGAIVIRDAQEPDVDSEQVAVLDDVLLGADGQLAPFSVMQAMTGRQGNVLLVNGHARPRLEVTPAGLHRFRFVNAATARYFRLSLGGRAFHVIGFDNGKLEAPRKLRELLLVPGARADVLVTLPEAETLTWESLSYDRGHGTAATSAGALFDVTATGDAAELCALPEAFATIEALGEPDRSRTLVLGEDMAMHAGHGSAMGPTFSINDKVFPDGERFTSRIGRVEDWEIRNDTTMDHPFHLHGFRFQVVAEDGREPAFLAYFDTVNVPAQQTTVIRIPLEANPGMWMFHCHILEHAERGMMGTLLVEDL
jgi:FtsP/CotA-like multicopper oxidase with cupredoxin domain